MFGSEGEGRAVQPGAAMSRYLGLCTLGEAVEAAKAQALANVLDEYTWPEEVPVPTRPDAYGARQVAGRMVGEDLCLEIAAANRTSVGSARHLLDDVEDLRTTLPGCWNQIITAQAPLWQARKVVQACVELRESQRALIDATLAPALGAYGPTRLLNLLDATVATARIEHIGPVLCDQVRQFTGATKVSVSRIIHVGTTSVALDAYEILRWLHEMVQARDNYSVFPYSSVAARSQDADHTVDWRRDGPPGQTRIENLGALERSAHRAKTTGGWHLAQPRPGTFTWRTPAGQRFRVDHTGTHRLPHDDG